uniref:Glycosyltransferase family 92 protein n=1 Tax=Panagrellus redivivus TaxID=6233 RepID=A0A7E4VKB9_PANRE
MFSYILVVALIILNACNYNFRPLLTKVYLEPVSIVLLKAYFEYPRILPRSHPYIVNERLIVIFFTNRHIYPRQFPINCIVKTEDTVYRGRESLERISSNETKDIDEYECGFVFYRLECPLAKNKVIKSFIRFGKGNRAMVGTPYADQVDRDLVFCMRPLNHDQHSWSFILTFIELARALQVNLIHVFINSIPTDLLKLFGMYEIERWMQITAAQNFTDLKYLSRMPFDASSEYLAQTAATMDCYHEHRQYTEFITFLDWGDLLLPRSRNSLPLELSALWGYHPYDVALRVVKHPAVIANDPIDRKKQFITDKLKSLEISLEKQSPKQRFYIEMVQPLKVIGVTARGAVWKSKFKKRIDTMADGLKTLSKVHILGDDFLLGATVYGDDWTSVLPHRSISETVNFTSVVSPQFGHPFYFDSRLKGLLLNTNYEEHFENITDNIIDQSNRRCQIRANARMQAYRSILCPTSCPTLESPKTTYARTSFVLDTQIGENVFYSYGNTQLVGVV